MRFKLKGTKSGRQGDVHVVKEEKRLMGYDILNVN